MKRFAALTLCTLMMSTPVLAGSMDAPVMDPVVIETAAATSSADGVALVALMSLIMVAAAVSN